MPEEKDDASDFKVVDRRPFSVDGTRREALREEPKEHAHTSAPGSAGSRQSSVASARRPVPTPPEDEPSAFGERELSGFETLVSYLSTTAMFQLGLLPGPGGERIPADLLSARRTIDLMEVLEEKTQGNLTSDEERLLDEVLYELRMSFVEIEKRGTTKKK